MQPFKASVFFLGSLLAAAAGCLSVHAQQPAEQEKIRLAILEISPRSVVVDLSKGTVRWLERQLGRQFEAEEVALSDASAAITSGRYDIVLSSSGVYRQHNALGLSALASDAYDEAPNPNQTMATAVLVLKDRTDLRSIDDLEHRKVAVTVSSSFANWQIVQGEVARRGFSPDDFFRNVQFVGMPMENSVDAVLSGRADAATLRACYLERLIEKGYPGAERLRVLDPRTDAIACQHSTDAYPGFTIATTLKASPETSRLIAAALFSMPPVGKNHHRWSIATNYKRVDALFRDLKIGPYQYLREKTLSRFVEQYFAWLLLAFGLIAGSLFHMVRCHYLVGVRTRQLQESFERQRRAAQHTREMQTRVDMLERVSTVQQISSIIAHELKQPIGAAQLFVQSLSSRIERGEAEPELVQSVLQRILELMRKSTDIIDHVRNYARKASDRQRTDVSAALCRAVAAFQSSESGRSGLQLSSRIAPGLSLWADSLEIELMVVNLLRNSAESVRKLAEGRPREIAVEASGSDPGTIEITVTDNGPRLTDEQFGNLFMPLKSSRTDGLGLGISIVRRLAQSYGGSLEFTRREGDGLVGRIVLRADDSAMTETGDDK